MKFVETVVEGQNFHRTFVLLHKRTKVQTFLTLVIIRPEVRACQLNEALEPTILFSIFMSI